MKTLLIFTIMATIILSCPETDEYCIACQGDRCSICVGAFVSA